MKVKLSKGDKGLDSYRNSNFRLQSSGYPII